MYNVSHFIDQAMERKEPMGYFGAHKEKKFPVLCKEEDFILKGTVQHDGNIQKVL